MLKPVRAKPLHDVEFEMTAPHEGAIILTDDKGKRAAYAINPDGLGAILSQGFGLASGWSDHPDLLPETFCGPMRALPANLLKIERGRHDKEVALRVRVGRIELSFLIPVDTAMSAVAEFIQHVDMTQAGPIRPH